MQRRQYCLARQWRSQPRLSLVCSPYPVSHSHSSFLGCRPHRRSIGGVPRSFRDVGCAITTVFECGDDDGNWFAWTTVADAGADRGTCDGPSHRARTRNPPSTVYLDVRAISATEHRRSVGCRPGVGSVG